MGEEVAQISVAIQATNDTASGIAAATASLKSGAADMGEALSETGTKATGAGGAIELLAGKLQEHKASAKQASESTKFFTGELGAIFGKSSEAGAALGKLAGGLAAGGPVGLAIAAATIAVGLLSKAFEDQAVEVVKDDAKLKDLSTTYNQIVDRARKAREAIGDVWVTDQGAKAIAELEREIVWQQKILAAEKDRVNLGDEIIAKRLESGRLTWEKAIVDEMNKEEDVTEAMVESRQANIAELQNELEIKKRSLAVEREAVAVKEQEKNAAETTKTQAKGGDKADADAKARELRTLNFLEETLAKQNAAREKAAEQARAFAERNEQEQGEAVQKIVEANEARRQELYKKTAEYKDKLITQQVNTEIAAASGVTQAWGTAAVSIIGDSKNASKAILKAFIQSIKAVVMAYAAQAAAAAMAANSGIPVVGIAVGTAAAGVAFSIVEAMIDKIPSARGGFDVPSGVNPLTQLHEREMVLPAAIADPLRAALATSGGLPTAPNVYISGIDGPSILKLVESPAFNAAIQENLRNNR